MGEGGASILVGGVYGGYHTQPNVAFDTLGVLYVPRWDRPEQYIAFYSSIGAEINSTTRERRYVFLGFQIPDDHDHGWYLPCKAYSRNVYPVADIRQYPDWHDATVAALLAHSRREYRGMLADIEFVRRKAQRERAETLRQRRAIATARKVRVSKTRSTAREMSANIAAFVRAVEEYHHEFRR
jgi:hypothetical protein